MTTSSFSNLVFDNDIAPVLRKAGNNRMPYLIVVDEQAWMEGHDIVNEVCSNLPIHKLVMTNTQSWPIKYALKYVSHDDEVMTELTSSNAPIAIFIGKASDAIMQIANERHECGAIDNAQWTFVKQYDTEYANVHAYVRRLIDNPDFIAFTSKNVINSQRSIPGLPKVEPWHTFLVSMSTHKCIMFIWDTREIVGFAELNDDDYRLITSSSNANDNCHLLYDRIGLTDETFNACLAGKIINN